MSTNLGIYSVGMYLPEHVRTNDWWPQSVLDSWTERAEYKILRSERSPEMGAITDGARKTLQAMKDWAADPFMGVKERRIAPDDMLVSDMETRAARDAITRAGIDPQEIDLVLGYSMGPDFQCAPTACVVHHNLGLSDKCITTEIGAVCNALAMQLTFAEPLIKSGRVRHALLIQSSTMSRLTPMQDPASAWFGDGATAVVVGPVSSDKGLLAYTHRTHGKYNRGLVVGVPGGKWYDGRNVLYSEDRKIGREMILQVADLARDVVGEVLTTSGVQAEATDFYASHQATPWLRPVTQEHIGLTNAKFADTFKWTASLAPSNAPAQFAVGEREGLIKDGSVVATFTGGGGTTCSGLVIRWGR